MFGIAAVLILVGHSQDFLTAIFPPTLISIIGYGGIGVTMFAFLSGVGLWQSYDRTQDIQQYYIRRVQRVVLPYLIISVMFNIILDVIIQKDFALFLSDVSCISFWTKGRGAWYVAWIVPIYMIYPFWAKATHSKSWLSLLLAALIIAFIAIFGLPTRFQSAASATVAFLCGDYAGRLVKENNSKIVHIMLMGILVAPLYMLRIIEGQAAYICFFALVGIGLCALFSVIAKYLPRRAKENLKIVGNVSLECYLLNIYLISAARIILGDKINSVFGLIGYIAVTLIGLILSCGIGRVRNERQKRRS